MELTNQYKSGLLKLAALLGLLCFFIMLSYWWPRSQPSLVLDEEAQCFVSNQELILTEVQPKKKYTYYVNSINDYAGYRLGLSLTELDNLFNYREKGSKIYTLKEFQEISKIDGAKLDSIKHLLVFPKYRPKKKSSTNVIKPLANKSYGYDINKVTSGQLYMKLGLPSVIANRIIKYRNRLKVFRSMEELEDVYDITETHLNLLKTHCKVVGNDFQKINLRNTTIAVLSNVPYLNFKQSEQIINFVKNHPEINSVTDLKEIQGFEKVKIARLPLYLTIEN